jgi:hypothetical protein
MTWKKLIEPIDATPIKNVYLSIIHDYDLKTALCELIDNSIDAWRDAKRSDALEIRVAFDLDQQTILTADNAGGVTREDLKVLVSPGAAAPSSVPDPIGVFGVGSKRSVVALAERIRITTRCGNLKTHRIEYDDEWIQDASSDWHLPAYEVDDIAIDSTQIELTKLRVRLEQRDVEDFKSHLAATYAHYLEDENIWLIVDDEQIEPRYFTQWAYPDGYVPHRFKKQFGASNERVSLSITSGLTLEERTLGGDYGVFVYCNRRLIARALRSPEVGFVSGLVGIDHHNMNLARVIVELSGPGRQMPWTSQKNGIYYGHSMFRAIRDDIVHAASNATKWSKALKPDFEAAVAPHDSGDIIEEQLPAAESIKNRMPVPPRVRVDSRETVINVNKPLAYRKPYVKGLYETVIAAEDVLKQKRLTQRNRIAWILLDSTVEIACKESLVHEDSKSINEDRLKGLNRFSLQDEAEKIVLTGDPIWGRFRYNYDRRNNFVHRRADVTVPDDDVENFLHDVKRLLTQAFGVRFPS